MGVGLGPEAAPPSLSQIYVYNSPTPNSSSISSGCKLNSPGSSRGAASHRAISKQGRGGGEQSAGGHRERKREEEVGGNWKGWEGGGKMEENRGRKQGQEGRRSHGGFSEAGMCPRRLGWLGRRERLQGQPRVS